MITVLITGVGGAGGTGAIRSLQQETSHEIVGVDMDPAAPGLWMADHGRTVPAADDPEWASQMADVVDTYGVDAVVPLVDEELRRLPDLARALPNTTAIVAPRQAVIEVTLDKYWTSRHLTAVGHAVPATYLATAADTLQPQDFPIIVKPRRGRGSRDVEQADSAAELAAYLRRTDRRPEELVIQEFVPGTEYTTSVVATRDDRLLAVVPKEVIEKRGSTVRGVTRQAPAVVDSCRRLFETLRPRGPMNVQQIVGPDGRAYTIEINPRFSSTACLTVAADVNELDDLIRDHLGEPVVETGDYEPDLHITRFFDHVFIPETELRSRHEQPV